MLRRLPLFKTFTLVALAFVLAGPVRSAESMQSAPGQPSRLRCEYLENPPGIDVTMPRFSWVLEQSERGELQTAYQVLIATDQRLLDNDQGDQWDSGKVMSAESIQVVYHGKPLESGRTYFWKVRTWDKEGRASAYSAPATFGMGLLSPSDWHGEWIGGGNELRKEFHLDAPVVRARVYVTALGYYELHINGHRVGHRVLDPAFTTYSKRVLYATFDVTQWLQQGGNAVGVMLGGGWATQQAGGIPGYFKAPALLMQMNVELEGGRHVSVATDTTWKTHAGPIVNDSIYDGEIYDARVETPGWDEPGFQDADWGAATAAKSPGGVLSAEMLPPIRKVVSLVPQRLTNPAPGVYVYDMGQNFSGWVELHVEGPRGARVELRFSELIYADGMINQDNLGSAKARDIYILRGGALETYQPRFTYHGFRYVEVTGFPGAPNLDSIHGYFVHSAVEPIGSFDTSKEVLNQIQHLIHWGQLSNLMSIPTDCNQRSERQGWMGDAQVTAEEAMMNFDMAAFYTNFVRDIQDAQSPEGAVPDTVPHKYGSSPGDPAWGTAYPLITWYMWQQYGDRRILQEQYDGLKKWDDFLRSRAQDNVLHYSYYGDWVAIEEPPGALISDAYYYYDTRILSEAAKILGKTEDATAYAQLADQIKDAFNTAFFNKTAGVYADGDQTAQVMPLFLDLVPKDQRGDVMWHLTKNILYTHNTHITTGFIGVKYLLPVLSMNGQAGLAYDLAAQTTYPSWGYMISRGATTLWELWQDKVGSAMNSHNHAMFGSLGAWFYRALGGIDMQPDTVGYRHLLIAPHMVGDLHWVEASIDTLRGKVATSWQRAPGVVTLDVTIPVNSDAAIVVPNEEQMTKEEVMVREGGRVVWEKGHYVVGDPGITGARAEGGNIVFDVGSGEYHFKLTGE
jgi:alpha-L-rhamnosidase